MDYSTIEFEYKGCMVTVEYIFEPATCSNTHIADSDWSMEDYLDVSYLVAVNENGHIVDLEVTDDVILKEIDRLMEVDL